MSDFFEFEKRASDGIRRKSPKILHTRAPHQKPVETATVDSVIEDELNIRTAEYEEKDAPRKNKNDYRAVSQDTPFVETEDSPEEKENRVLPPRRRNIYAALTHIARFFRLRVGHGVSITLSEEIKKDSRSKLFKWGALSGIAVLCIVGIALPLFFPRLVVTVKPVIRQHGLANISVIIDHKSSEVDGDKGVTPAELLEFSRVEKANFPATGQKYVEEGARGMVRIYNKFSSAPQGLKIKTRFITDTGAIYRLPRAVSVPGAAIENDKIIPRFIEAELVADEAGSEGNIQGEIMLKIPGFQGTPKYEGFYAEAIAGFKGGAKGETKVVTKDDIARAEEEVTKKVFDALKLEIAKKIPPDFKVVEGLREIEITQVTSPRGLAIGDTFTVEARAVGRVLVFRERDIATLLRGALLKENKDTENVSDMSGVIYTVKDFSTQDGRAEILLSGNAYTKPIISERGLAALLQGKHQKDLLNILKERSEIKDFSLALFPPWAFRAPAENDRIKVIIKE